MSDITENYDVIDLPKPEPKELGLEVRRQGQGRARKDLVFDPATGEFVLGDDGVRGSGDIVTQMTEDGFASEAEEYRYNEQTGDFEPPPGRRHGHGPQIGDVQWRPYATAAMEALRKLDSGDLLLMAGGVCATLVSSWIGGPLVAIGIAKKFGRL